MVSAAVGGLTLSLSCKITLGDFHSLYIAPYSKQRDGSSRPSFNWPYVEVPLGGTLDPQFI